MQNNICRPVPIPVSYTHLDVYKRQDYKNRYEKDDTLAMALAVQSYLQEKDVNVIMTRSDDTFLKLSERCDIANEAEADYYVSLHRNTGEGYGVETWVYSGANEETMGLAGNIQQGLAGVGVQRDRDVKKGTQKSSSKAVSYTHLDVYKRQEILSA